MESATLTQLTDRALTWCMDALLAPNYRQMPFARAVECALGAEQSRRLRLRTRQCEPEESPSEVTFTLPRMTTRELYESTCVMFASATGYCALAATAKGTPAFADFQSAARFCGAVMTELRHQRRAIEK